MKNCFTYKSPVGKLLVCTEDIFLTDICFTTQGRGRPSSVLSTSDKKIIKQLDSYFAGKLKKFDLPIKLTGTTFQKSVWKALGRIPYGHTRSYSDIAKM
ncbi:MAG: MGMT family protein, partial [Patescibacteria group bacterium]|nr:MGMT family protein [Patescibacteria group bacterium]